jgi:hypothetical protein
MYAGGVNANNGNFNPGQWDWSAGETWGYMIAGGMVGALSGLAGGALANMGMPLGNTFAMANSSLLNSIGTHIYTGGQSDISIGFGIASYNLSANTWGYLGKKGNSALENIGYSLGALANLGDIHGIYTDYKAVQHAAKKGTPIPGAENIKDMDKPWDVLGTKYGYRYYGASKTGWDPEVLRYTYGIEPTKGNALDELAYLHDVVHYNNGTEGALASVLSTNRATIASDFALARGAMSLITTKGLMWRALTTTIGMYSLAGIHTVAIYSYYWHMLYNYQP